MRPNHLSGLLAYEAEVRPPPVVVVVGGLSLTSLIGVYG